MTRRIFLDTSVVLAVAYNEGASDKLCEVVRRTGGAEDPGACVLTAPVLVELWSKIDQEVEHFTSYNRDLSNLILRIRNDAAGDARTRPGKLEVASVLEFAGRLQAESSALSSFGARRRQAIIEVTEQLAGHASGSELTPRLVHEAFALESELQAKLTTEVPNRLDLLILASVLAEAKPEDAFLTLDEKLRIAAKAKGLSAPHPEEFANAKR